MKGYKVFNPDWTCKGFQYEVGKTYEMAEKPIICQRGFHFCEKAADCFNYYKFDSNNKIAEIEANGELDFEYGGNKHCTNKIKIVRELNWHEVLNLVNSGESCTGLCNSGNQNSGHYNSGHYNRGYRNSGNYNLGDWNSGDFNLADHCSGCFNTIDKPIMFFDKQSNITMREWRNSEACQLLNSIGFKPTNWIESSDMTEAEKESHPEHETTGGYLKIIDNSKCCVEWWNGLTAREKSTIKEIPNFDTKKFSKIMSIPLELIEVQ